MDPLDAIHRALFPRPMPPQIECQLPDTQMPGGSFPSSTIAKPTKQRQPKSATKTDQEWEDQKPKIIRLLVEEDLSLKDVMHKMDEDHHFQASRKQYNTKIEQWRIGKNVKDSEMRAIIRKEKRRKMEHPPKDSIFRVRNYPVEPQKIARFKRDKGFGDDDIIVFDAGTPSDISCDTPQPENCLLSARATPEDCTRELLGTMQSMTPFNSYFSILSPRLQMAFNSPHLGHPSPNLALPTISPTLGQPQYTSPGKSSLTRPTLSHHWPSKSPGCTPYSPLHGRASNSPPVVGTELSRYPPMPSHGDRPFEVISDESIDTALRNLLPDTGIWSLFWRFIREPNTYESWRSRSLLARLNLDPNPSAHSCNECAVWNALVGYDFYLHYYCSHPNGLPHRLPLNFLVSEAFNAISSGGESNTSEVRGRVAFMSWLIIGCVSDQEVEKVFRAITRMMEREPEWSILRERLAKLSLADIYISSGKYDLARHLVRDVLEVDFSVITTIANTAKIDSTNLNGNLPPHRIVLARGDDGYYLLTEEGRKTMKQYMGQGEMAIDVVQAIAIVVLQRLSGQKPKL